MERDTEKANRPLPPPFEFCKAVYLIEATTCKAASLSQLLTGVTLAEELSIFYHLHRRFFVHLEILLEHPNDFAQWVAEELGNGVVAERLANLNLFRAPNLREVRREISVTLAEYLAHHGDERPVRPGREFIFCQPRFVILPCGCRATAPHEFLSVLHHVEGETIAYHLFAPKVGPERQRNDFATWFEAWGYSALAHQLDSFDPYLNSLEDNCSLRHRSPAANHRADLPVRPL
jgi:hypothetical protein